MSSAGTTPSHLANIRPSFDAMFHYLGIALIFSWFYCLWFVPTPTSFVGLTSIETTYTWLLALAFTTLSFIIVPAIATGLKKRLSDSRAALYLSPLAMCATTLLLCFARVHTSIALMVAVTLGMGLSTACLWLLWSECYARNKATFEMRDVAPAFVITLLPSFLVCSLLPWIPAAIFVSALPLASGAALPYTIRRKQDLQKSYPSLLPQQGRRRLLKSLLIVGAISFILCGICFFIAALIPQDVIGITQSEHRMTSSTAGGITILCIASIMYAYAPKGNNPHTSIPLIVICGIISIALFVAGSEICLFVSFGTTCAIGALIEIILITFFGSLSSKGYLNPIVAFGLAGGIPRGAVLISDGIAVMLEQTNRVNSDMTIVMSLISMCALSALLIPLMREEQNIVSMTNAPMQSDELAEICNEVIEEFGLSAREGEVLRLISKGYSVDSISKKLVISPYTTQTHVRHIYSKMNVHKRSELLDYINMHRGEKD